MYQTLLPTASSGSSPSQVSAAKRIESFGVMGAGLMASQLALLVAEKLRVPVLVNDVSASRVTNAIEGMQARLKRQEAKGRLAPGEAAEIGGLIRGSTKPTEFSTCDAAIEAVYEELSVKRTVFRQLEESVASDALILTNTSSLSVAAMARGLLHPERVLGFHFFNPVAVLPLLELVRTPFVSDDAVRSASDLAARLGKTAVHVADTPGFVVNRILTRIFSEILAEIDKGADPATVDNSLESWGLPMTPLQLIGYIGPSVQRYICDTLHRAYPDRFHRSTSLDAVVQAGLPGFFDENGIVQPVAVARPSEPHGSDVASLRRRVREALDQEVQLMLDEGVVATSADIDRCMVLGANFPAGGLSRLT